MDETSYSCVFSPLRRLLRSETILWGVGALSEYPHRLRLWTSPHSETTIASCAERPPKSLLEGVAQQTDSLFRSVGGAATIPVTVNLSRVEVEPALQEILRRAASRMRRGRIAKILIRRKAIQGNWPD